MSRRSSAGYRGARGAVLVLLVAWSLAVAGSGIGGVTLSGGITQQSVSILKTEGVEVVNITASNQLFEHDLMVGTLAVRVSHDGYRCPWRAV